MKMDKADLQAKVRLTAPLPEAEWLAGTGGQEPTFTTAMIDAIYAAWHGAGVDIAGGDWARFVGMLPRV